MNRMRTLLLQLPATAAGPAAVYGVAELDLAASREQVQARTATVDLLPRPHRTSDVVAMVPADRLSWHRVNLPAGLGHGQSRKLQMALQGLLEDRLLQDVQQVHLALAPQWRSAQEVWAVACDKAWLRGHLQTLQDAGLHVQRIVPEFSPPAQGRQWHALGDDSSGWLWCCDAEAGVNGWPVATPSPWPTAWLANASVQAEPGLARWLQAHTDAQLQLCHPAAHWRDAAASAWNLAQFDLQNDIHSRRLQGLRRLANALLHQPRWRAARWGLVALLASQLLGLQAWAWMTRQQWQAEQDQWTQILLQSFPKVSVVVDAPLQMAREVAVLQENAGQRAAADLESQLQALGQALPAGTESPLSLNYQDGQLQWPELALDAAQQSALTQALHRQGYRLRTEAGISRMQTQEQP